MSFAHPPLANQLYALPGVLIYGCPEIDTGEWEKTNISYAQLARADYPRMRGVMMAGRLVGAVCTVAFFAFLYLFTRRNFGQRAALVALTFTALNPTLLAHGGLYTTDFPVAALAFCAAATLIDYLQLPSWWRLFRFGVAAGATVVAKYTGLPFVALLLVVGTLASLFERQQGQGFQWRARAGRLVRRLGAMAVAGALIVVTVNTVYVFKHTGLTVDQITSAEPYSGPIKQRNIQKQAHSPLRALPGWVPIPLPYTYVYGLAYVLDHNRMGHHTWFLGASSRGGLRSYFPVLFLLKTPLPVLLALAIGPAVWLLRRARVGLALSMMVGLMFASLAMLLRSRLNIGFRHALLMVPFASVVAAVVVDQLLELASRWRESPKPLWSRSAQALTVAVSLLVASSLVPPFTHFPDYLGYFNAILSRRTAHREVSVVGDDWGQNTYQLAQLALRENWKPLYYQSITTEGMWELRRLNVKARSTSCRAPTRPGYYAFHASEIVRNGSCRRALGALTPIHVIHDHIYVYQMERKSKQRGAAARASAAQPRADDDGEVEQDAGLPDVAESEQE